VGQFASSQKSQLRRQFLTEDSAGTFAKTTELLLLENRVANGAAAVQSLSSGLAHEIEDRRTGDQVLDAKIAANKAASDSADAALLAAVGAISVPGDPEMEAAALRVLDAALPVLDPPLAPLEVVVDALGAKKKITFGARGQVALVEDVV